MDRVSLVRRAVAAPVVWSGVALALALPTPTLAHGDGAGSYLPGFVGQPFYSYYTGDYGLWYRPAPAVRPVVSHPYYYGVSVANMYRPAWYGAVYPAVRSPWYFSPRFYGAARVGPVFVSW